MIGIAKGAHYVIDGLMATILLAFALLLLLIAAVLSILAVQSAVSSRSPQ